MSETPAETAERCYGRRTRPGEEPALEAAIARAMADIAEHLRPAIPGVTVFHFGALDYFPGSLALWVRTKTDAQRDALLADRPAFEANLRARLGAAGYPAECLPFVCFTAQADETVDRDHAGNWYYAVK